MKNHLKLNIKATETNLETDIDESSSVYPSSRPNGPQMPKKKGRRILKTISTPTYYQRILRFQLKHLGRTLRIPCYEEGSLNMPVRFTRKLNAMEVDNDVQTDEEVVEGEIDRCCGWLKEAIQARAESPQKEP